MADEPRAQSGSGPETEYRAVVTIAIDEHDTLRISAPDAQVAEAVLLRALAYVQRKLVIQDLRDALAGPRIVAPGPRPSSPLRPVR